ncbi:D-alanyl-D-alanine dipeptidase [Candidatus Paracaedibacter symbiosus]|uniref:D-alanyl-D-alanine dipeptidase n=1 Tax=Candidatus Paracaedibacter symbiosus TaxID=244582 RepID=UPI0005097411|nr:D-alanyl-D-alanine dipeptidase [Candidatus Paracaedibacter symbiosus]
MSLIEITELTHNIVLDMRYATPNNFTAEVIYASPRCFLHQDALFRLEVAIELAAAQGLRFKILDAYRPQAAQEKLWSICPDSNYIAPPQSGSHHTRGIAVDLTLIDEKGNELDMGTPFDSFEVASHHGTIMISKQAAHNRYLLLGIMMSAGWDLYLNEWWHYQLFKPREYPLILGHEAL